jgi:hypothetical protein
MIFAQAFSISKTQISLPMGLLKSGCFETELQGKKSSTTM